MGNRACCDLCGVDRPQDDLVPVQEIQDARACLDCVILMEDRPDRFVVAAPTPDRPPVRRVGPGDRRRPGPLAPPGPPDARP